MKKKKKNLIGFKKIGTQFTKIETVVTDNM